MWGTLFGRGAVDIESTADQYTQIVLGSLLTTSRTSHEAPGQSADMVQLLDEARERLDRMAQLVSQEHQAAPPPSTATRARGSSQRKKT